MPARRYTARLYYLTSTKRGEREVSLDPSDDGRLREVLEEMVKAARGNLDCDLSQWSIRVSTIGSASYQVAALSVDSSGRSVVKR